MDITTPQEIWIRVYCAALTGQIAAGKAGLPADLFAREAADLAMTSFNTKFSPLLGGEVKAT